MSEIFIYAVLILIFAPLSLRQGIINSFKIGYYETKLKNRGVDVSHIENIGIIGILKYKE